MRKIQNSLHIGYPHKIQNKIKRYIYIYLNEVNSKLDMINKDVVTIFQYMTGIELNKNFSMEREIIFDPKDAPVDHFNRYQFAADYIYEHIKEASVADIACTCGYGSYMLSKKAKNVIGVDINQDVINFANKIFKEDNLSFVCQDAQNLQIEEKLDAVVSFETIEHIPHPEIFLKSVGELLKENGKLICSVPNQTSNPYDKDKFKFHFRHYTLDEIKELLNQCGFELEKVLHQYYDNNCSITEKNPNFENDYSFVLVANKK